MKRLPREPHCCRSKTTSLRLARETMVLTPSQLWWSSVGNSVTCSHRRALQMDGWVTCAQCNKCYTRVFENIRYSIVTDNGSCFTSDEFATFMLEMASVWHRIIQLRTVWLRERCRFSSSDTGGTVETRISRFLFRYRNTPQSTTRLFAGVTGTTSAFGG